MQPGYVVVTGVAGFIGSHLARRLCDEGHRVVGIDGLTATTTAVSTEKRLAHLGNDPRFDLVVSDVRKERSLRALGKASTVFHLAARPGARDTDYRCLYDQNVRVTAAVVGAVCSARHIVLASSSSVYGAGTGCRSRETDRLSPLSFYGRTKQVAEALCLRSPARTIIVRLFTVYGPGQRSDMAFARFIDAACSGVPVPVYHADDAERDFTYVGDAVEGMVRAWCHGRRSVYNIAGGTPVRVSAARGILAELIGRPIPLAEAAKVREPTVTRADLGLAWAELGFRAQTDLKAGLEQQLAEHRSRLRQVA